jgi:imidazole glycerol-phosphate synthase subunit HisH
MITIIDYGNTKVKELNSVLLELTNDIIISNKEKDILDADKIIIPDSKDLSLSIKKLHLYNLFSVLRMIKNPVLGIGTGMHLMTKSYKNKHAACLGCFPVECESKSELIDSSFETFNISIVKETKLLNNVSKEDKFQFNTNCFIPVNEFTTSSVEINGQISASLEKDNLYGVQFIPEKSGVAGLKVLGNFLQI